MLKPNLVFDRKTFNLADAECSRILGYLRSRGIARLRRFNDGRAHGYNHRSCCASSALNNLYLPTPEKELTYLDIGCGDSPDVLIAAEVGYKAFGLDLFEPAADYGDKATFIKRDACEVLPFPDGSVWAITSQAMIDLVEIETRAALYADVMRVLVRGGTFSQVGVELTNGHGFNQADEVERVRQIGFRAVNPQAFGFLAVK